VRTLSFRIGSSCNRAKPTRPIGVKHWRRIADENPVIPYERCPQCAALVRPEQAWCTLCHADLRPPADLEPDAEDRSGAAPEAEGVWDPDDATLSEAGIPEPAPVRDTGAAHAGRHGRHSRASAVVSERAGAESTDLAAASPAASSPYRDVDPLDAELALAGVDVDGMLAALASKDDAQLRGWVGKLDSKPTRVLVVTGATLIVTAGVVGLMFLFGTIFH